MSRLHDHDFHPPLQKRPASAVEEGLPNSSLAVVSLVFGILGFVPLPVIGSIIAIVTGHAARGQIRDEEGRLGGRALARAGLTLGYLAIALWAAVVGLVLWFTTVAYQEVRQHAFILSTPAPARPPTPEAGVKMVNEMQRGDFRLIADSKADLKGEEIIAFYNAGKAEDDPELALLTSRRIIYIKEGRTTAFDLKGVADIMDDEKCARAYQIPKDSNNPTYTIEIRSQQGPRMRLRIHEWRAGQLYPGEGKAFFEALESTWKAAGGKAADAAEKAAS